jgi:restriction system protein
LRSEFQKFHQAKEQRLKSGDLDISNMSWVEFERYLAKIFETHGYHIEMTSESGDQWADIIAEKDGKRLVIQAKRYSGSVGNGAIQEVIWAIKYYDGTEGWVITNSIFTNSAQDLARVNYIRLIDGESLSRLDEMI